MDIQLLCNGKRLAIVHDDGSVQSAYVIEQPLLKSYSMNIDNNLTQYHGIDELSRIIDTGMRTINTDLSFIGNKFTCAYGEDLLVNMFDDYSIGDLFKIINSKIDERK